MESITKPSLTRLSRKAGVKSVSDESFDTIREIMDKKILDIIRTSIIINSENLTKTLMPTDIYTSIKITGTNIAQSSEL
jgi:histone H3/H4